MLRWLQELVEHGHLGVMRWMVGEGEKDEEQPDGWMDGSGQGEKSRICQRKLQ